MTGILKTLAPATVLGLCGGWLTHAAAVAACKCARPTWLLELQEVSASDGGSSHESSWPPEASLVMDGREFVFAAAGAYGEETVNRRTFRRR